MKKISRQPNYDNEIKKITQELHHAEKMAKKWLDKVKRRKEELFEINRLAIFYCCEKNLLDYNKLKTIIENLPSVEEIVAQNTEDLELTRCEEVEEENLMEFKEEEEDDDIETVE